MLLLGCMLLPNMSYAAKAENGVKEGIAAAMAEIMPYKELFGLDNVDFATLEIGHEIKVYNFVDDSFVFSRNAYPLFSNDELVGILYQVSNTTYQFMTGLAEKIRETESEALAIVYDAAGCHIYNGQRFYHIIEEENISPNKDILPETSIYLDCSTIEIAELSACSDLGMANVPMVLSNESNLLSVTQVLQTPYEHLCWAASIAMIVNYRLGYSYDVEDVAWQCQGSLADVSKYMDVVEDYLQTYIDLYSKYGLIEAAMPSQAVITYNIDEEYPVFSSFRTQWGSRHDTVTIGYTPTGNIVVLDPKIQGAIITYPDLENGIMYIYTYPGSEEQMILSHALCAFWVGQQ